MSDAVTDDASVRPTAGAGAKGDEPRAFRLFEVAVVAITVCGLAIGLIASGQAIWDDLSDVAVWLPVVVVADLMPVTLWAPIELAMSLPVLLASAMVFPPVVAFLLGFVANTDRREFRRDISLIRGLFNRSNVGLSVLTASWLFHETGGDIRNWPSAVGFAFLALAVDMLVNNSIAFGGAFFLFQRPIAELVSDVYGRGNAFSFFIGYVCFGSVAILLASVYLFAGNWGLIVFMIPIVLAHEMFSNGTALGVVRRRLRHQQRAFASLSERIADERRDERLSVAADLHDEVLPPLFKVHLMGQVIRQDIESGRLLALDDDVPGLLQAANAANDAVRVLIRDLRRSSLGPHGLRHTIGLLVQQVESEFGVTVDARLDEVTGHPVSELLAYQIAREALNNCVKHARGPIRLALIQEMDDFRLVVEDNGPGFETGLVDEERHFGLQLMRERVELCGGTVVIDSRPGEGTTIAARFPVRPPFSRS